VCAGAFQLLCGRAPPPPPQLKGNIGLWREVSRDVRGATLTTHIHLEPKVKKDWNNTSKRSCTTSVLCYSRIEISDSQLRVAVNSRITQKQKTPLPLAWYTFRSRKILKHRNRCHSFGRYQVSSQLGYYCGSPHSLRANSCHLKYATIFLLCPSALTIKHIGQGMQLERFP
jgi:hypothetical protein